MPDIYDRKPFTISAVDKWPHVRYLLDVWKGSEYASDVTFTQKVIGAETFSLFVKRQLLLKISDKRCRTEIKNYL